MSSSAFANMTKQAAANVSVTAPRRVAATTAATTSSTRTSTKRKAEKAAGTARASKKPRRSRHVAASYNETDRHQQLANTYQSMKGNGNPYSSSGQAAQPGTAIPSPQINGAGVNMEFGQGVETRLRFHIPYYLGEPENSSSPTQPRTNPGTNQASFHGLHYVDEILQMGGVGMQNPDPNGAAEVVEDAANADNHYQYLGNAQEPPTQRYVGPYQAEQVPAVTSSDVSQNDPIAGHNVWHEAPQSMESTNWQSHQSLSNFVLPNGVLQYPPMTNFNGVQDEYSTGFDPSIGALPDMNPPDLGWTYSVPPPELDSPAQAQQELGMPDLEPSDSQPQRMEVTNSNSLEEQGVSGPATVDSTSAADEFVMVMDEIMRHDYTVGNANTGTSDQEFIPTNPADTMDEERQQPEDASDLDQPAGGTGENQQNSTQQRAAIRLSARVKDAFEPFSLGTRWNINTFGKKDKKCLDDDGGHDTHALIDSCVGGTTGHTHFASILQDI